MTSALPAHPSLVVIPTPPPLHQHSSLLSLLSQHSLVITDSPSTSTDPDVGSTKPSRHRMVVVLPACEFQSSQRSMRVDQEMKLIGDTRAPHPPSLPISPLLLPLSLPYCAPHNPTPPHRPSPAPLGPSRPKHSFRLIARLKSSTAVLVSPATAYVFRSPAITTDAEVAPGPARCIRRWRSSGKGEGGDVMVGMTVIMVKSDAAQERCDAR